LRGCHAVVALCEESYSFLKSHLNLRIIEGEEEYRLKE